VNTRKFCIISSEHVYASNHNGMLGYAIIYDGLEKENGVTMKQAKISRDKIACLYYRGL